jgi:tRNA pseudouridine38-40 synthase
MVTMTRVKLLVAYDGSGFHGFAPQPGVATVGGTLADAISRVARRGVELTCAGRTDAGVHAWGQVVTFDLPDTDADTEIDLTRLQQAVNKLCAPAIVVRSAAVVPSNFDARHSARSRVYRYTVLNREVPDPFLARTAWWVPAPLDRHALVLGCDPLIGEHDFSSFCRQPKTAPGDAEISMVRRVLDARWEDEGDGVLELWIEANAFCHQMVRSIAGTLVDVGLLKRRAGEVAGIIRAEDRAAAGEVAPSHGLCLWEVRY